MAESVIVIVFPETENQMELAILIEKAQELYSGREDVRAKLAVNDTAQRIVAILKGEFDEKLMRRAVASTQLSVVLPPEESEREGDETEPGVQT